MPTSIDSQPIAQVRWLHRDLLKANNYNPNAIAPPELELLKLSILEDGWTCPIVTLPEQNGRYQIVDGYHRWPLSGEPEIYQLTSGLVPTVQVTLDRMARLLSYLLGQQGSRGALVQGRWGTHGAGELFS